MDQYYKSNVYSRLVDIEDKVHLHIINSINPRNRTVSAGTHFMFSATRTHFLSLHAWALFHHFAAPYYEYTISKQQFLPTLNHLPGWTIISKQRHVQWGYNLRLYPKLCTPLERFAKKSIIQPWMIGCSIAWQT